MGGIGDWEPEAALAFSEVLRGMGRRPPFHELSEGWRTDMGDQFQAGVEVKGLLYVVLRGRGPSLRGRDAPWLMPGPLGAEYMKG